MFEYMTAKEAAEKWNVSLRWVQRLCKMNRIENAMNINRIWLIPTATKKPPKLKTGKHSKAGKEVNT